MRAYIIKKINLSKINKNPVTTKKGSNANFRNFWRIIIWIRWYYLYYISESLSVCLSVYLSEVEITPERDDVSIWNFHWIFYAQFVGQRTFSSRYVFPFPPQGGSKTQIRSTHARGWGSEWGSGGQGIGGRGHRIFSKNSPGKAGYKT